METDWVLFLVSVAYVVGGVAALNPAVRACPDRRRIDDPPVIGACKVICYFQNQENRWALAYYVNGTECRTDTRKIGTCYEGTCVTSGGDSPGKEKKTVDKPKKGKKQGKNTTQNPESQPATAKPVEESTTVATEAKLPEKETTPKKPNQKKEKKPKNEKNKKAKKNKENKDRK
uniref:Putative conserved secreted protein n=1 Tax=Ornithodoros turicata TaxID=34597 RepID=A0A2R5LFB8_9ACAR